MRLYSDFEPMVSIVLPTFNRSNYLKRAIISVLGQESIMWELIIVDDGSNDNTFQLVLEYQKEYENIRYLRHSNRKPPLTINAGIQASIGKYVTFLGSDDEYKPDHLKLRVEILENDATIDLLHGGVEIIGDPYVKDKNDLSKKIHISKCTVGATLFGKREVFLQLGGFKNLLYSDDSEFYERAKQRYSCREVDSTTYIYYRDTPDSICSTIK
ncbi:MAG: glycosyltransferase [Bacteroidetes bacterium]|nr:glycosyltransferase [Bacteroidota bacterium]